MLRFDLAWLASPAHCGLDKRQEKLVGSIACLLFLLLLLFLLSRPQKWDLNEARTTTRLLLLLLLLVCHRFHEEVVTSSDIDIDILDAVIE